MSESAAVEQRIADWEAAGETVLSPSQLDVAAVRRGGFTTDGDQQYTVLMMDGTTEVVAGDTCTCGNERPPADMTEPLKTGRRKRLARSCLHQKAALQAVNCGGRCSECGELSIESTDHGPGKGVVTYQTYTCAGCGTQRRDLDEGL